MCVQVWQLQLVRFSRPFVLEWPDRISKLAQEQCSAAFNRIIPSSILTGLSSLCKTGFLEAHQDVWTLTLTVSASEGVTCCKSDRLFCGTISLFQIRYTALTLLWLSPHTCMIDMLCSSMYTWCQSIECMSDLRAPAPEGARKQTNAGNLQINLLNR